MRERKEFQFDINQAMYNLEIKDIRQTERELDNWQRNSLR